jgi:hypothetical protein
MCVVAGFCVVYVEGGKEKQPANVVTREFVVGVVLFPEADFSL